MRVTLFRDLPTEGWYSMERYADELTAALQRQGCAVRSFVAARPLKNWRGRGGALFNHFWRMVVYPAVARRQQGDLNHILDHSYAHLLEVLDPQRTLVTCHDIAPLVENPGGWGLSYYLWQRAWRALPRAAHIITASQFTRRELLRHLKDYPPDKITPVGYGVSSEFSGVPLAETIAALRQTVADAGQPLIVHVGSCLPRKNIETLIRAVAELRDLKVIWAQVGGHFSLDQRRLIRSLGLADSIVQLPAAKGLSLCAWYRAADVLVFPSLYEGFGLPVIEAMAAGVPVVCARAAALPEVAGEAAVLVAPRDSVGLAAAIREVLTNSTLRQELIERGRVHSRLFTWEATARRTWAVYHQVYQECRA